MWCSIGRLSPQQSKAFATFGLHGAKPGGVMSPSNWRSKVRCRLRFMSCLCVHWPLEPSGFIYLYRRWMICWSFSRGRTIVWPPLLVLPVCFLAFVKIMTHLQSCFCGMRKWTKQENNKACSALLRNKFGVFQLEVAEMHAVNRESVIYEVSHLFLVSWHISCELEIGCFSSVSSVRVAVLRSSHLFISCIPTGQNFGPLELKGSACKSLSINKCTSRYNTLRTEIQVFFWRYRLFFSHYVFSRNKFLNPKTNL